jgi:hypothetical protein
MASLEGWIQRICPSPLELNPMEVIWAHGKPRELPNLCPKHSRQRSEAEITAFWQQALRLE